MRIPFYYLTEQLKNQLDYQVIAAPSTEVSLARPRFLLSGQQPETSRLYVTKRTKTELSAGNLPASSAILSVYDLKQ